MFMFSESSNIVNKRQIFETALFSASYLWDFNPGWISAKNEMNKMQDSLLPPTYFAPSHFFEKEDF